MGRTASSQMAFLIAQPWFRPSFWPEGSMQLSPRPRNAPQNFPFHQPLWLLLTTSSVHIAPFYLSHCKSSFQALSVQNMSPNGLESFSIALACGTQGSASTHGPHLGFRASLPVGRWVSNLAALHSLAHQPLGFSHRWDPVLFPVWLIIQRSIRLW